MHSNQPDITSITFPPRISTRGPRVRFGGHQITIIALMAVLAAVVYASQPAYLSAFNIDNILRMASIYGISALGMTLIILTGGIDLSAGSVMALGGALAAGLLGTAFGAANPISLPPTAAVAAALAVAALIGAFNGIAVSILRITPFVVTLGMMTVARGLTFIFCDYVVRSVPGSAITFSDPLFDWLGSESFGPAPTIGVIFLGLAILLALVLRHTHFGRAIYAIGGDAETARLAGIGVADVIVGVYAISGALSALSGVALAGRLSSVSPQMAVGYELEVITIVIVGGSSLAGGRGNILGTVLAALLISMVDSGLNILNVQSFYQYLVKGAVLLAAVLLDQWQRHRDAEAGEHARRT